MSCYGSKQNAYRAAQAGGWGTRIKSRWPRLMREMLELQTDHKSQQRNNRAAPASQWQQEGNRRSKASKASKAAQSENNKTTRQRATAAQQLLGIPVVLGKQKPARLNSWEDLFIMFFQKKVPAQVYSQ